ncbi:MAG TPA: site-2 protease family protein [Urbifossiella sp.]|nr:site-2 protease family protein [Urbifossiella sp.]
MFGSLKLGKLFGIDVLIHGTFWLLPLFVFLSGVMANDIFGAAFDVVVLLGIFVCVALHEAGHALAARHYGIATRDITLYPMGGIASLERMPERPGREIAIALAGPVVNFAIAFGILGGALLGNYLVPLSWVSEHATLAEAFLGRLLIANAFLGLFNLLPAFPMDGGRVLRAVLSYGMPRLQATRVAVTVGTVLAIIGGFLGILTASLSLVLVAVVVFVLGRAELAAVHVQEARKRWHRYFYGDSGDDRYESERPPPPGHPGEPIRPANPAYDFTSKW